jgi:hypothetical protein
VRLSPRKTDGRSDDDLLRTTIRVERVGVAKKIVAESVITEVSEEEE